MEKRVFCDEGDNEYEIEFRNVSFRYPGSEARVLKNVSVKLGIGKRLAIVGMNGSGKTTFIKLLCRLYDPTEGEILLNGIDRQVAELLRSCKQRMGSYAGYCETGYDNRRMTKDRGPYFLTSQ